MLSNRIALDRHLHSLGEFDNHPQEQAFIDSISINQVARQILGKGVI